MQIGGEGDAVATVTQLISNLAGFFQNESKCPHARTGLHHLPSPTHKIFCTQRWVSKSGHPREVIYSDGSDS